MSKTIEQIEQELDQKIPRSAVSERDGGGGRRLSYLEGHYVIDRLNKVFGALNWDKEILDVRQIVNTTNKGEFPAYLVKVRLHVRSHEKNHIPTVSFREGYGYGADKSGMNAHELAIKEAVTDALKVAAKDLGQSMGLALYDKTQENVDDNEEPVSVPSRHVEAKLDISTPIPKPPMAKEDDKGSGRKEIEETIRGYVKVAEKQKRLKEGEFKQDLLDRGVTKLSELNDIQLKNTLEHLQELTK